MISLNDIKTKILNGGSISESEAISLSQYPNKQELYDIAYEVTQKFNGNKFDTCSIANAKSGNCSENCKWCAQSAHWKTKIELYPVISLENGLEHALYNDRQGIKRFALVTSGKRINNQELEQLCKIYREIKKEMSIKCCASMGLLSEEQLKKLKDSGVENYHCNIETAPSNFPNLCTSHTLEQKMETIHAARKVGLRICSGGIIGMGETMEQRIEMAFFLQKEEVLSIPLNLLHPIPGTPLQNQKPLSEEELLTTIALFRLINPKAYLRFCGGRAQLPRELQMKALHAGINSAIMGGLLTTVASQVEEDKKLFAEAGFSIYENTDWKS